MRGEKGCGEKWYGEVVAWMLVFFFFEQMKKYEMFRSLVGWGMCKRDRREAV